MNPILDSRYYIPDVEARQWEDGIVYLYGSSDRCGDDVYCSREYYVFSSKDLKNWTVYPNSFNSEFVHDVNAKNDVLYAPDCEKINGKYCLFYCQEKDREGVAFSDKPYGPFRNARSIHPADKDGIDPAILVDDDGSLYYFWGQYHARGGKLNLETGEIIPETLTDNILTEEEHGFHEGISIRKRNGIYYLVYSDISRGRPTCLGYAMSDKPLGPYKKKGIIIDNTGCDPQSWNDHGSIAEINKKWYVFYHRSTHASNFSRQVCIEPIYFEENGTIREVEMTTQGIDGPLDAFEKLEAYRACGLNGKCYIDDYSDKEQCYQFITDLHNGDQCVYKYLRFDQVPKGIRMEYSCLDEANIKVYLDGDLQNIVAEVSITPTQGRFDFVRSQVELLKNGISGVHSLHLEISGGSGVLCSLKSIQFV